MRKTITQIIPVLFFVLFTRFTTSAASAAGAIRWGNSLKVALAAAKKTDRLVMVDLYTDWCGYCKKLDAETYTDPAVIRASQQIIPVKLNAERESDGIEIATRLHVRGFPCIYFLNGAGEVEGMVGGFEPAGVFLNSMQGVIQQHHDLPVMQTRLRTNPNDLPAAAKLTAIYSTLGKQSQANSTLARVAQLDPSSSKGYLTQSRLAVARMCLTAQQVDKAISLYELADKTARTPEEHGVADINIAICYATMRKYDKAESELHAALSIPGCPAYMKQGAQQMLARVQQARTQRR